MKNVLILEVAILLTNCELFVVVSYDKQKYLLNKRNFQLWI